MIDIWNIFQYVKYLWWKPVKNKLSMCWLMLLLGVIPLCVPLILKLEYESEGIANVIGYSTLYKLLNMTLFGISLPFFTETLMDYFEKTSDLIDIMERMANFIYFGLIPLIIVILALTSTLTSQYYWFLIFLQRYFLVATFTHNLFNVTTTISILSHNQIFFTYLVFCVSTSTHFYDSYANASFLSFSLTMFYISVSIAIISSVMWGISIYKVLEKDKWRKLSYTEYKVVILFVGFLFYIIGNTIIVNVYDVATDDFLGHYTEEYLCVSTSVVIIHALIVTILPGRASRRMVEKEREILTIKREFVKSISNEITSPLYVSHVSLEVLKAQLKSDPDGQMDKVQDQVDNIYSANETALSIMNDLLQYENIDTGTFKLTRKVVSMKHVFKGRFKPLHYLAQKYQVNLLVFDEIGASEYFKDNNSSSDTDTNTNSELNLFNAVDLSTDISKYSIDIDIISVDQMLRNIMYTMVKNTPLGGTITLKFTTTKKIGHPSTDRRAKQRELEKHYLTIEFSYISVFDESQEVRDFQVVIFDPNKPVHEGDSGMDLWIANKIIDAHSGQIDFHCDVNRRNPKFLVNLPLIFNEVEEVHINFSNSEAAACPDDWSKESGRTTDRTGEFLLKGSDRCENRSVSISYKKVYIIEEEKVKENQNTVIEVVRTNELIEDEKVKFLNDIYENTFEPPGYVSNHNNKELVEVMPKDKETPNNNNIYSKSHSKYPLQTIPMQIAISFNIQQDEFSFVSFLTSGSCSDVFTAVYQSKNVIVKMIKAEFQDSRYAINEISSEIEILTRCCHTNIIRIYGCGKTPRPFLVLEYLKGGTLAKKLSLSSLTTGKIDDHNRVMTEYALTIAKTMKYLHSDSYNGLTIIHRDLKPENIGFDENGILKIFDFGLASTVLNKQHSSDVYQLTGFTGSIRYMAPEVAMKQPYSEKVDVYSFGVLLWQMITLQKPYAYANGNVVIGRVVLNNERPIITSDFPKHLKDLLTQCWNKDSDNRPDFSTIVNQLEDMLF